MKKEGYTIGEIAKLLRIPAQTIRYYEKEGLIQPKKDPDNGYRLYTFRDIELLLDILFYRRAEVPIKDIHAIIHGGGLREVKRQIDRQEAIARKELINQKLLVKKLQAIQRIIQDVETGLNRYTIEAMAPFYVLFSSATPNIPLEMSSSLWAMEHFDLCSTMEECHLHGDGTLEKLRTFLILEESIAQDFSMDLSQFPRVAYSRCMYNVAKVSTPQQEQQAVQRAMEHLQASGEAFAGTLYLNHLFPVNDIQKTVDYYEIILPIL